MSLRIAIVEDNARFRDTVRKVLKHAPGYELVAAFPSVEHLSSALTRPQTMAGAWGVVLMDIDLPGASGIEGTQGGEMSSATDRTRRSNRWLNERVRRGG